MFSFMAFYASREIVVIVLYEIVEGQFEITTSALLRASKARAVQTSASAGGILGRVENAGRHSARNAMAAAGMNTR
jgi:hypothetical protein